MFASIRRYRLRSGSIDELARRVDDDFAPRISAQPGFRSYEFLDCGYGQVMTISVFAEASGAEASRELAQRWSEESLLDFRFEPTEALLGEVLVSRAVSAMLEPPHSGAARRFASVRRFRLRRGSVRALMHTVDQTFVERIQELDGFVAYHALDCGGGDVLSVSLFRDAYAAEESNEVSRRFVSEELGDFDLERAEAMGGEVVVSRALAEVLEPAHAY
jgi:heme-degrading monooxygenase HmoA